MNPLITSLLQSAPDTICILVTDQQQNNTVCFCTNSKEFLIIGIDLNFKHISYIFLSLCSIAY